jgi:hypothetical protein
MGSPHRFASIHVEPEAERSKCATLRVQCTVQVYTRMQTLAETLRESWDQACRAPVSTALEGPLKSYVNDSRLANMDMTQPVCS